MYSMTQIQHLGQMSHDLQENPAARLTPAPEHNGLFMPGVSDTDVWCSTLWFDGIQPLCSACSKPGLCFAVQAGGPTMTPDFTFWSLAAGGSRYVCTGKAAGLSCFPLPSFDAMLRNARFNFSLAQASCSRYAAPAQPGGSALRSIPRGTAPRPQGSHWSRRWSTARVPKDGMQTHCPGPGELPVAFTGSWQCPERW